MRGFAKQTTVTISFGVVPDNIREFLRDRYNFRKDTCLKHVSELSPFGKQTWGDTLKMSCIESYWKDQTETNGYDKDLESFVKDYGLVADVWLINTRYDFTDVKDIFFDLAW